MYTVRFSKKAEKILKKVDPVIRRRVLEKLKFLEINPRNGPNIKTLQGYSNCFRYRLGDFRIVYEVIDKDLVVWIFDLGWRGDMYR